VGLSGVVVNNAIVLIDFIHILIARGMPVFDAVVEATSTRLRPIFLASFTTIFGVLPSAYGIGGYDVIVKPMALAFGSGLMVSTLLTLFLIPALYLINEDIINNRYKIFKKLLFWRKGVSKL
jgi:multidrug efflux pump subunit AcrB